MALRAFQVPWWISAGYFVGMLSVFIGQRALGHTEGTGSTITWVGLLMAVGATLLRAWTVTRARGQSRRIELYTLLCYLGGLVALFLYALTTTWGLELVGLAEAKSETVTRFTGPMMVLWCVIMAISLVTLLMIELAQGFVERGHFVLTPDKDSDAAVEAFRVSQLATSGLTIGLAVSFLFMTCQAAEKYDVRKDVSYFKTSVPGEATVNIVSSVSEPIDVYVFFPDVNEVKEEAANYFESLADATGKIQLHEVERFREVELSKKYKVSKNGTIVLARGDKSESFDISDDIKVARKKQLRTLDEEVQKALLKLIRAKRVAYWTTGHGELNNPESLGVLDDEGPKVKVAVFKEIMRRLNYEVRDLAPHDLLAGVPDDATMVMSLAPRQSFTPEEEAALDKYLAAGGAVLLVLDPAYETQLGTTLQARLGVAYSNVVLADDKEFLPQRQNVSDHVYLTTNQFTAHASVTTLSRRGARSRIVMIRAGSLSDAPFAEGSQGKRTYVVKTMTSAFADQNGNFVFDEGSEKRDRYNVVAAIEDPSAKLVPKKGDDEVQPRDSMRAMVMTDAELFNDGILLQVPLTQLLVADSVKWLGGEERFSGDTTSEEDVKIEHTKNEDEAYFYLTIILAPVLVLGMGLLASQLRRRRIRRAR